MQRHARHRRRCARAAIAVVVVSSLAGCDAPLVRETRYTGTVAPDGACGHASQGTLTTAKGRFTFAPDDGVLLLSGDVAAGGAVAATLATPGADRKPFVMRFEGRLDPTTVTGRYTTPRCAFDVRLTVR